MSFKTAFIRVYSILHRHLSNNFTFLLAVVVFTNSLTPTAFANQPLPAAQSGMQREAAAPRTVYAEPPAVRQNYQTPGGGGGGGNDGPPNITQIFVDEGGSSERNPRNSGTEPNDRILLERPSNNVNVIAENNRRLFQIQNLVAQIEQSARSLVASGQLTAALRETDQVKDFQREFQRALDSIQRSLMEFLPQSHSETTNDWTRNENELRRQAQQQTSPQNPSAGPSQNTPAAQAQQETPSPSTRNPRVAALIERIQSLGPNHHLAQEIIKIEAYDRAYAEEHERHLENRELLNRAHEEAQRERNKFNRENIEPRLRRQSEIQTEIARLQTEITDSRTNESNKEILRDRIQSRNAELSRISSEMTSLRQQLSALDEKLRQASRNQSTQLLQLQRFERTPIVQEFLTTQRVAQDPTMMRGQRPAPAAPNATEHNNRLLLEATLERTQERQGQAQEETRPRASTLPETPREIVYNDFANELIKLRKRLFEIPQLQHLLRNVSFTLFSKPPGESWSRGNIEPIRIEVSQNTSSTQFRGTLAQNAAFETLATLEQAAQATRGGPANFARNFSFAYGSFQLALGLIALQQLGTNYAKNPMAFEDFKAGATSVTGAMAFGVFMMTAHPVQKMLEGINNGRVPRSMIPYLGMTAGMLAASIFHDVVHDQKLHECAKSIFGANRVENSSPCRAAYNEWVISNKIVQYAPAVTSMLLSAFISSGASTGFQLARHASQQWRINQFSLVSRASFRTYQNAARSAAIAAGGGFTPHALVVSVGQFVLFLGIDHVVAPIVTDQFQRNLLIDSNVRGWLDKHLTHIDYWFPDDSVANGAQRIQNAFDVDARTLARTHELFQKSMNALNETNWARPNVRACVQEHGRQIGVGRNGIAAGVRGDSEGNNTGQQTRLSRNKSNAQLECEIIRNPLQLIATYNQLQSQWRAYLRKEFDQTAMNWERMRRPFDLTYPAAINFGNYLSSLRVQYDRGNEEQKTQILQNLKKENILRAIYQLSATAPLSPTRLQSLPKTGPLEPRTVDEYVILASACGVQSSDNFLQRTFRGLFGSPQDNGFISTSFGSSTLFHPPAISNIDSKICDPRSHFGRNFSQRGSQQQETGVWSAQWTDSSNREYESLVHYIFFNLKPEVYEIDSASAENLGFINWFKIHVQNPLETMWTRYSDLYKAMVNEKFVPIVLKTDVTYDQNGLRLYNGLISSVIAYHNTLKSPLKNLHRSILKKRGLSTDDQLKNMTDFDFLFDDYISSMSAIRQSSNMSDAVKVTAENLLKLLSHIEKDIPVDMLADDGSSVPATNTLVENTIYMRLKMRLMMDQVELHNFTTEADGFSFIRSENSPRGQQNLSPANPYKR